MTKSILMAAAAVVLFTGAAHAAGNDWRSGLYIKGGAGWNQTQDQDYNNGATRLNAELDDGYAISGAVGYDYGDFRTEVEVTYRDNDIDGTSVNGVNAANGGGSTDSTAFMANGYYDIPTGTAITPYVGAGIGVAKVNVDGYTAGAAVNGADDDDTVFAYQAMAGAEYALDTKTSLYTEYKYFGTDDVSVRTVGGTSNDLDYDNHSIMVGARYSLN